MAHWKGVDEVVARLRPTAESGEGVSTMQGKRKKERKTHLNGGARE
jgi:hypothetical protein